MQKLLTILDYLFSSFAGVVARRRTELVEVVESLPLAAKRLGDFVRGRMGESERQVDGLFQSLLSQSFGE